MRLVHKAMNIAKSFQRTGSELLDAVFWDRVIVI